MTVETTMVRLRDVETTGGSVTILRLECWRCKKLLAERITTPYEVRCPRCKAMNAHP